MVGELILIVEDDPDIVELLEYNLRKEGFRTHATADGSAGLRLALEERPSLVLLDLMLPGIGGLEVCRLLRGHQDTRDLPIIVLTAREEEDDIIGGLEAGADDYMTKPFRPRELLARIRAALRRAAGPESEDQLAFGAVRIDRERHEVKVADEPVKLTRTEFRLLSTLAERRGRVFTRDQLLARITDGNTYITSRNIDVHIRSIRRKLGSEGDGIVTVRGVGYKCRE